MWISGGRYPAELQVGGLSGLVRWADSCRSRNWGNGVNTAKKASLSSVFCKSRTGVAEWPIRARQRVGELSRRCSCQASLAQCPLLPPSPTPVYRLASLPSAGLIPWVREAGAKVGLEECPVQSRVKLGSGYISLCPESNPIFSLHCPHLSSFLPLPLLWTLRG